MKIAYIITAYKDEHNLVRLIKALNSNCDFYIHVDLKVNILKFKEILLPLKNVYFTDNRYFINWGGFGQVLSQKELLRCIIESEVEYSRIVCISGTDYPVWSNAKICSEFAANTSKQYISAINISKSNNLLQSQKIYLYHFFRDIKLKNYFFKKCFSGSARIIFKLLPFRKGLQVYYNNGLVDVFFGSDYWALTNECAKFVYQKMCTEPKLMRYFKYSFVPSELCVQTIVFNSHFAIQSNLYPGEYPGLVNLSPLHYIEYGKTVRAFVESDYEMLLKNDKMFFRKALTGISDTLLDKIDLYRKNKL